MTTMTADVLSRHLLRSDGQEDLCFALWRPSGGLTRETCLLKEVILPEPGDRHVHGNASFEARYFLRALGVAVEAGAGVAFLHSHPGGRGWQGLSDDDWTAEAGHAGQTLSVTGLPLLGMTRASGSSWSARVWHREAARHYVPVWADTVRVVGTQLQLSYNPATNPAPPSNLQLLRTVAAWGDSVQADLARLHVGVVGAGSVGAVVAEALARLGIARLTLFDFDSVELHNLDRLLHATQAHAGQAKVAVLAEALRESATAPNAVVEAVELSVVEEEGFRRALDCDVLFSCVDRPWPRAALNLAAYAHLIPVVDGGIDVETSVHGLRNAHWRAHVAAPGRRCLECLGQYDPGLVQAERQGLLDDPHYIRGLPANHALRRNENVFPFSLSVASFEVLQFLRMVAAPGGVSDVGGDDYHFTQDRLHLDQEACAATCPYSTALLARGDSLDVQVTGPHQVAEASRAARATQMRNLRRSIWNAAAARLRFDVLRG